MHFLPRRSGHGELGSQDPIENEAILQARKNDMKNLLEFVKNEYPEIEFLATYTWLQNKANYRILFPSDVEMKLVRDKFSGLWGQFMKWDGSASLQTYNQFLEKLKEAKTMEEVFDAIPMKVLGTTIPLEKMYKLYSL